VTAVRFKVDGVVAQIKTLSSTTSTPITHSPHQVCWDFYHAAKLGFRALAEEAGARLQQQRRLNGVKADPILYYSLLPGDRTWEFWDQVVSAPASLKLPDLKDAARTLRVKVS